MKRVLMSILAIVFPWLALLIYDNPGGAIVALVLQATAIGWIPASIWAWKTVHSSEIRPIKSKKLKPTDSDKQA